MSRSMGRRRPDGSVLLLSIFFLMVLFFLAIAFLGLLPTEMRAAGQQRLDLASFYAADAGIVHALAWLESSTAAGRDPLDAGETEKVLLGAAGPWQWKVKLVPDAATPPNGTNSVRVYTLESVASLDGEPYRKVISQARQDSFARFAWFEDQRDPSLWIPANLYHFDGPFHSNSRIRVSVPAGYYSQNGAPTFEGEVNTAEVYTGSPDGVDYGGEPPYDSRGNPLPERYNRLYRNGRDALKSGVKQVEMPQDSRALAQAAWGSESPLPTSTGVHLGQASSSTDLAGGVYIVGDVDSMTLGATSDGNPTTTVKQGSSTTLVLEAREADAVAPDGTTVPRGSTLVVQGSSFTVYNGLPNGAVYCEGNIRGLQGVNRGKRSIGVDLAARKEIVLSGSVTRADTPVGEKPTGDRDSLGILAYKVRVPTSVGRNRAHPLDVYAAVFAGVKGSDGGLYIDDPGNSGRGAGRIRLYGGLMMSHKPVWGYFSGASLLSGMTLESYYDPLLASNPPPFFPTIGKFRVVRYGEEAVAR